MSDNNYRNRKRRSKRRSRSEKIGFYTALSVCLIAVSMAVYSTYNTVSTADVSLSQASSAAATSQAQPVNKVVTGVQQPVTIPEVDFSVPEITASVPAVTEISENDEKTENSAAKNPVVSTLPTIVNDKNALETMLSTDLSLTYPLASNKVMRDYSENSVYFKTLNVWKPHSGIDFGGELGDDVVAMTGGAVTKVYDDKMFGKTVEISINNAVCIYSGLGTVEVKEGDSVNANQKIGTVGCVPFEANDPNHIHIAVKIDGKYADPLSFIGNDE